MTQSNLDATILIVDDDHAFRVATQTLLQDEGWQVVVAKNGDEGVRLLETEDFDLVLSDLVMGRMSGIAFLQHVKEAIPGLPVIMVTGFGSIATAVEAMRMGALDYLTKPCNNEELIVKVRKALEAGKKDRELKYLREELNTTYSFGNMVSRSAKMKEVFEKVRKVADADVTVLIQGASGTGKELVARALHFNSNRKAMPFVAVNCSAIPENLLESELFGHERGAFTGAIKQRVGKFEEANGSTLFLDEIGDIAPSLQSKLLRVLQEKKFERVGGNTSLEVNTRVVAATNRNLEMMMRDGDFREDLFYRLNVFPISLPPLRDRLEDIPLLSEHLLKRYADLAGGRTLTLAPEAITNMMNYDWPGNIRELENLLKRAMINATGGGITALDLPQSSSVGIESGPAADPNTPFKDYVSTILRDAEKKYLLRMLEKHKGNINQIAKLMEVDRKTVYRKMSEHSINPSEYRS